MQVHKEHTIYTRKVIPCRKGEENSKLTRVTADIRHRTSVLTRVARLVHYNINIMLMLIKKVGSCYLYTYRTQYILYI